MRSLRKLNCLGCGLIIAITRNALCLAVMALPTFTEVSYTAHMFLARHAQDTAAQERNLRIADDLAECLMSYDKRPEVGECKPLLTKAKELARAARKIPAEMSHIRGILSHHAHLFFLCALSSHQNA